jgi:hypothetical protein
MMIILSDSKNKYTAKQIIYIKYFEKRNIEETKKSNVYFIYVFVLILFIKYLYIRYLYNI